MQFEKSLELYAHASKVIPMGTSTFSRSPALFAIGGAPLYIQSAKGCRVIDVDGNEFIDYAMGLAIVNLGYANEEVVAAAHAGAADGMIFTLSCPEESRLAHKLVNILPCAEMVRFFKNGSDSCEGAVKLARAYTGKQIVLTVGGYHGFHDWYVASTARNRGIPSVLSQFVIPHAYNDLKSIRETVRSRGNEVAAIIMEPVVTVEPESGFLESIRALATENGIVLIFDEMKTGFRLHLGGGQTYFKVTPDLAVFGKGLSNGFPLSALVGKRKLMELFEDEHCFMSGSYATEKASLLAALKTVEILERGAAIPHIWKTGEMLKSGLAAITRQHALDREIRIVGLAPMQHVVFAGRQGVSAAECKAFVQQECAKRGVLFVGYHHTSFAHSEDDIRHTLEVYDRVFGLLADSLANGDVKERLSGKPVEMAGVRS